MKRQELEKIIDRKGQIFVDSSIQQWGISELNWHEYRSAALECELLEKQGFTITRNLGGIETAFMASYGSGYPVIAFLGEYDALRNLSQKADLTTKEPVEGETNGHGCGHNLLGTAAIQAATALKDYMEESGITKGTIRYYGCPAEEGGSGKPFMLREGCFEGVDVCFTWHPGPICLYNMPSLASASVRFNFHGVASHAGSTPHLGRSALDALELMNVGSNFLREHVTADVKIHYAIKNAGGFEPNIVQSETEIVYQVRANHMSAVKEVLVRIQDIAKGAALMTGTTVDSVAQNSYADVLENKTLTEIIKNAMDQVLPLDLTEEELEYAAKFKALAPKGSLKEEEEMALQYGKDPLRPVSDYGMPSSEMKHLASTDAGDVSWNVPTSLFNVTTCASGTPHHNWLMTAQGKSPIAQKGMRAAALIMAMGAVEVLENQELVEQAKKDFDAARGGQVYECLIPAELKPGTF